MKKTWDVTVWGVRGSMPMAGAGYVEYGGNTSCVSVDYGEGIAVFDAGSGLVRLGNSLKGRQKKRIDLFVSHVHLDHIIGLCSFQALHDPEMEIHLYGEARCGVGFREQLDAVLSPPYWPLSLADFRARIEVHELKPGDQAALGASGEVTVSALRGNHPNLCLLYRMESAERSIVYGLDCEMEENIFRELVQFSRGADLLIWDACYTEDDLARRRGWGHSCWEEGAALAREAGVKLALMAHYASEYTDEFLREQERLAGSAVRFAREGMEITV